MIIHSQWQKILGTLQQDAGYIIWEQVVFILTSSAGLKRNLLEPELFF